jgi:two-component system NtrC family sensor kinase
MRFIFLIFAAFLFCGQVEGQIYLQKLQADYQQCKTDSDRVFALCELGDYYGWQYSDSAFFYVNRAINLSDKIKFTLGKYLGLRVMCFATIATGNYPKALEIAFRKQKVFEEFKGFREPISWTIPHDIAVCYRAMGNVTAANAYLRETVQIVDQLDAWHIKPIKQLDFDKFGAYGSLGQLHLALKNQDSALWYTLKAYNIARESDNRKRLPLASATLGNVYEAKGDYKNAQAYYRIGIEACDPFNALYFKTRLYNNLAGLFRKVDKQDSCIYYAHLALHLAQKYKYGDYAATACSTLATVYNAKNSPDSELKYTKIMLAAKDTIFSQAKIQQFSLQVFDEQQRQLEIEVAKSRYRDQIKLYALLAALGVFLLLSFILYLNNRNKRRANLVLQLQKAEIDQQKNKAETTLHELKSTQAQLIQSEKMASLGELTAGIAHEIQNPLNFVNNFSEVNKELIEELENEMQKGKVERDDKLEVQILDDLKQNLDKIYLHGKRADAIVKGMLQHSSASTGQREPTDINALADKYLRLAYHGLRAKDHEFNATIKTDLDPTLQPIKVIPQDIGRVMLNLVGNAFYAVYDKAKMNGLQYEPAVTITTRKNGNRVEVKVIDNGNGIPKNIAEKVFQPFFTTKPTGQGTGLGLSLAYEIITKGHGGELKFESKEGEGTAFIIHLPIVS